MLEMLILCREATAELDVTGFMVRSGRELITVGRYLWMYLWRHVRTGSADKDHLESSFHVALSLDSPQTAQFGNHQTNHHIIISFFFSLLGCTASTVAAAAAAAYRDFEDGGNRTRWMATPTPADLARHFISFP